MDIKNNNLLYKNNINGLRNLGNTCYINVVIQCLNYTIEMTKYFIEDKYLKDINKKEENCVILNAYVKLIKGLSNLDKTIAPVSFVKKFKKINKYNLEQQDSHEALISLINDIHKGISREVKMIIINKKDNDLSKLSWKKFFEKDYSEIINIFYGQLYSKIECDCKYISENYEPYCSISCEIPNLNRDIMLNDCLDSFFFNEKKILDYKCSGCKNKSSIEKKLSIKKLPNHLIIHLKRFIVVNNEYVKNNRKVSFATYLNMYKYVDKIIKKKDSIYYLYGIINHRGMMSYGHYYSYCYTPNDKWYMFNDDNVEKIEKDNLCNNDAYILFYKKL